MFIVAATICLAACPPATPDDVAPADAGDLGDEGDEAVGEDSAGEVEDALPGPDLESPGSDSTDAVAEAEVEGEADVADAGLVLVAPPGASTYHKEVRPLVAAQCFPCHETGGAAGYTREFETFEAVSMWAPVMVSLTASREMPPWPPGEGCRSYRGERLLTEAEIAAFQTWIDDGTWEGDPADYVPPEVIDDPGLEATLPPMDAGAAYTPDSTLTDDYHCLPMTFVVDEPLFMTGYDLLPDAKEIVHHALIYEIPPSMAAELEALDAADPEAGYPCGTTPQTSTYGFVGSWVPGQPMQRFPEDSGIYLETGTRFVLQMHYNVLGVPPGTPLPADRTSLVLHTRPVDPLPANIVYFSLVVDASLLIPAGAVDHVEGGSFGLPAGATMVGIFPHMHLLGTEIRAYVEHEGGGETCLVDIAKWDFDWQQFFMFGTDEPFVTETNDVLTLECVYDNSAENQPVVNGAQQAPKTVTWGEGTTDEMCLAFPMWLKACAGNVCTGLPACMESCAAGDLACYVTCTALAGPDCGACANGAAYDCGVDFCPDTYLTYIECSKGGGECDAELGAWYACAEPFITSGVCNRHFLCCGATFGE